MTETTVLPDRERTGLANSLNRFTRSPRWLPIVTIATGFLWVVLEEMRNRLAQIRFDLDRLGAHVGKAGQAAQEMSDATALVLSRAEHLAPGLSGLALAALLATFLLSLLTVLCPGLSKPTRGGTIAIVLLCVVLVFWEIQ